MTSSAHIADPRRLVALGSNRWAFKPELGLSKPKGRWTMEAAGGLWMFTPNRNFFGGSRREQKPIMSLQGDLIYTLRPRMWVSVNGSHAARWLSGRHRFRCALLHGRRRLLQAANIRWQHGVCHRSSLTEI